MFFSSLYDNVDLDKKIVILIASVEGKQWLGVGGMGIIGKMRRLFTLYPPVHSDFEHCECVTLNKKKKKKDLERGPQDKYIGTLLQQRTENYTNTHQ